MKQKSAKDIAFEKERAKFRSEIRELKNSLNINQRIIDELNETIMKNEQVISQQEEWIERLLEYTEMSKEDLQKLIINEKHKAEIRENMACLFGIAEMFGGHKYP